VPPQLGQLAQHRTIAGKGRFQRRQQPLCRNRREQQVLLAHQVPAITEARQKVPKVVDAEGVEVRV
jgi:hypothetical protein